MKTILQTARAVISIFLIGEMAAFGALIGSPAVRHLNRGSAATGLAIPG